MNLPSSDRGFAQPFVLAWLIGAALLLTLPTAKTQAQGIDCARLQQMIATGDRGNRYAAAAHKQAAELSRTVAYAHQLGCDRQQFLFFGGSTAPQCGSLNARIAQMQANLSQLQAAEGGGRGDLVARYNAYCRGGQPAAQPRQRGFFESLFGGGDEQRQVPPADMPSPDAANPETAPGDGDVVAHGGSQAVCVRTCDGGFFPLPISTRHSQDSLNEMCSALCPGTQAAVYTRNPNAEIKTAVALDGTPYMDLPNALKFQKSFDPACSCRPAGKSWAEALAGAEAVLGDQRKGDILVTPEKSAEMSRPKMDSRTRASLLGTTADAATASAAAAQVNAAADPTKPADQTEAVAGPDGVKRHVRQVGPKL